MHPYLTAEEIAGITGHQRPGKQLAWLRDNGFTALARADGSVLMSRRNFEAVMGGWGEEVPAKRVQEPDFTSLKING